MPTRPTLDDSDVLRGQRAEGAAAPHWCPPQAAQCFLAADPRNEPAALHCGCVRLYGVPLPPAAAAAHRAPRHNPHGNAGDTGTQGGAGLPEIVQDGHKKGALRGASYGVSDTIYDVHPSLRVTAKHRRRATEVCVCVCVCVSVASPGTASSPNAGKPAWLLADAHRAAAKARSPPHPSPRPTAASI